MRHLAVVDLGFGDAGKGTVVDWLCSTRHVEAVVRFNGGGQAAHNVVRPDGRHHTFAQFGAGTLAGHDAGRRILTVASRYMMVEPFALAAEAEHLHDLGVGDPFSLLRLHRDALLTTPFHAAANRAAEIARGDAAHGSCGIGVGQTAAWALDHDAPRVGDGFTRTVLRRKLVELRDAVLEEHATHLDANDFPDVEDLLDTYCGMTRRIETVDDAYMTRLLDGGPVVFEAAQGVLLDEWRGFHPHTTWSTTTLDNVVDLVTRAGGDPDEVGRLGVLRTYTTRHGAGPFPTEDATLAGACPEPHNGTGRWQGDFRVGHFDVVAHAYAVAVAGRLDGLVLTHTDAPARAQAAGTPLGLVSAYDTPAGRVDVLVPGPFTDLGYQEQLTGLLHTATPRVDHVDTHTWIPAVEAALGVPVVASSSGPTWADKDLTARAPAWLVPDNPPDASAATAAVASVTAAEEAPAA